jgi:ribonucleoside-diphosphate reductase alpha chain
MKSFDNEPQLDFPAVETQHPTEVCEKLKIPRFFTTPDVHPYDELEWEYRSTNITNDKGQVLFELQDVEVPTTWSQNAINIVASKYFHSRLADGESGEQSVKQLIDRVAQTLTRWGNKDGYFNSQEDAEAFEAELTHLLVNQKAAFNSPVWFNMGIEEHPQCSACFINSVDDTMESILELAKTEGLLFKYGSGTGTNFSSLRSSKEKLSSGGIASGPVSFMRGYDAFAGVIKSGGKTRRAAKMVILDIDHPDIEEFINIKAHEEQKAWALIDAGYDGSFGGEAYNSVFFQNSNNSVRVSDKFMKAVEKDGSWHTRAVTGDDIIDTYKAKELFEKIAQAAHICGDPGIQFDTTINEWHTCPNSAPINASNPCSEYMFVDNSACNLASLNLLKFIGEDGAFDVESFRRAVHILIIAQELIVDNSSYPTDPITKNSSKYRTLGLGYANLGALLMYYGRPYDSEEGRSLAAVITSLMTGQAYLSSAILSSCVGPFSEFEKNRKPMLRVLKKHQQALKGVKQDRLPKFLFREADEVWTDALETGTRYGFRNAQVSVLAPTGTIGFMMDCDTTGIEPDIALVKYKKLSGGGMIKLVNNTVAPALKRLAYNQDQIDDILKYIQLKDTIEGAPHLQATHLPVFDCAFKPVNGTRFIHHMGHVKMMAAVQPFLSGAISKTVNMPKESKPDDIFDTYVQAWKLGLKSIAIYRDGSKRTQPLNMGEEKEKKAVKKIFKGHRERLPDERRAWTHKFSIAGHDGYITVGEYEDGRPGEIFLVMAKEGSFVSGLMDSFSTAISIGLQYGVPLRVFVDKFSHTRFEPDGFTNNPEIPIAKSVSDYIFRWLEKRYMQPDSQSRTSESKTKTTKDANASSEPTTDPPTNGNGGNTGANQLIEQSVINTQEDAPPCHSCGAIMVRNGSCYKCLNCGETSGCS